jgi:hypothetical protein
MSKTLKVYISLFILAVIGMFYYESVKPKPINWFPSYAKKHKIPFGTYILYQELTQLFPDKEVKDIAISPYIYLKNKQKEGTYIFIDQYINFDEEEFNQLLTFVSKGNDVFLSTKGCNIDTLGLETKRIHKKKIADMPYFKLYNPIFKNKEYTFDRKFNNIIFSKIDTTKVTILGQTGFVNEDGERSGSGINFIKYPFGKGNFYFHTFPEAFTNYQLLNNPNENYAAGVLSYLNNTSNIILWDSYYKTGKSRISSPMHYILSQKSLKWAYLFTLIGVLFFVFFEGKRKQRSIPVIKPLKNQTLAFTRTIANMYFEQQEHKNIAEHQIQYLLEYIRTKLRVPTDTINKDFITNVASRSGKSRESVQQLFNYIDYIHSKNEITELGLEQLNKMIEKLKKETED